MIVVLKHVDKNPSEDGHSWPKHVRDNWIWTVFGPEWTKLSLKVEFREIYVFIHSFIHSFIDIP
jgi:hypothetical protein